MASVLEFDFKARVWPVWKQVLNLAWPVTLTHILRTLLRTTDLIVAGFFSPAAVAAVGLADVYARFPAQIGAGIGGGAIALSSQDTGSGAIANRNEAITQAILLGLVVSLPFILFGVILNEWAIVVLGAESDVVTIGAAYLFFILLGSPGRHMILIATRSLQGTGDTRTPMFIRGGANAFNIVLTVILAFGPGPTPELGVVGIAIATMITNYLASAVFLGAIHWVKTDIGLVFPRKLVITKQIAVISVPRIGEGLTTLVAAFPFNAILLAFGTEVNAAYHIGRRMRSQFASPLSRGYGVATNVIVGQFLGENEPNRAYIDTIFSAILAVGTVGILGVVLFVGAPWFVLLFTRDPGTLEYAVDFARVFAVATVLMTSHTVIAGALRGGSETRPSLVGKIVGMFVFLLGITYFFGLRLEYGVVAAYAGILANNLCQNVVVWTVYLRKRWLVRAKEMMDTRESSATEE